MIFSDLIRLDFSNQEYTKTILVYFGYKKIFDFFSFLLNNVFDAGNKPNTERINSIKFLTKMVL